MDKLIYLASPYSSEYRSIIDRRVRQVEEATAKFIQQGNLVFSPIVHSHPIHELVSFNALNTSEVMTGWTDYDRAMIYKADELWVLCLTGWELSLGVDAEVRYALDHGMDVRYIEFPSLKELCKISAFSGDKKFAEETDTVYAQSKVRCRDCKADLSESFSHDCIAYQPKQTIIGLNGVARSGKDTVGKYLVENHGFVRVGLADAVRDAAYALNPRISEAGSLRLLDVVDACGWESANGHSEVRRTLQRLGTEVGRNFFGENCWIEIARAKIEAAYQNPVVITDIRFENEAEFVRELGGRVCNIRRTDDKPLNDHASEQKIDGDLIDWWFLNDARLSDLYLQIERALDYFNRGEKALYA